LEHAADSALMLGTKQRTKPTGAILLGNGPNITYWRIEMKIGFLITALFLTICGLSAITLVGTSCSDHQRIELGGMLLAGCPR
jgi:hypothetical protein